MAEEEDMDRSQRRIPRTTSLPNGRAPAQNIYEYEDPSDTDMEMDRNQLMIEMDTEEVQFPQQALDDCTLRANQINSFSHRWIPPTLPTHDFIHLLDVAKNIVSRGLDRDNDRFEHLIARIVHPAFHRFLFDENSAEWNHQQHVQIVYSAIAVVKILRAKLESDALFKDIPQALFSVCEWIFNPRLKFYEVTAQRRCSELMDIELDLSEMNTYIKDVDEMDWYKCVLLAFACDDGFNLVRRFLQRNFTQLTQVHNIAVFISTFNGAAAFLRTDILEKVFTEVVLHAVDVLEKCRDEDLDCKNLRGDMREHLLYKLNMAAYTYLREMPQLNGSLETLDKWRLHFILKVLNDSSFNARMSAIETLSVLFEYPNNCMLTNDQLEEWVQTTHVVEVLTRDNLHHISYVDRVERFIRALLDRHMFSADDLTTLWEAQRGKHDVIQRNLYDTIVRIVTRFDNELITTLFNKIQNTWDDDVRNGPVLIDLLRRIGENIRGEAIGAVLTGKSLNLLWDLSRTKGITPEIRDQALRAHLKVCDDNHKRKENFTMEFVNYCIDDIRLNNEYAIISVEHLQRLLCLYSSEDDDSYPSAPNVRGTLIVDLDHEHDLIREICKNTAEIVRKPADEPNRSESLTTLLQCLTYLLGESRQQLQLQNEQVSELWQALILSPIEESDRSVGFLFFANILKSSEMDENIQSDFFRSCVISYPAGELSEEGFECFHTFFQHVNLREGNMSYLDDGRDTLVVTKKLVGIEYLELVMLDAPEPVANRATEVYVDLLVRFRYDMKDERQLIIDTIHEAVKNVTSKYASLCASPPSDLCSSLLQRQTLRYLRALSEYITKSEQFYFLCRRRNPPLGKSYIVDSYTIHMVYSRRELESEYMYRHRHLTDEDDDGVASITVHSNMTMHELRHRIANQLAGQLARDKYLRELLLIQVDKQPAYTFKCLDYKSTLGELDIWPGCRLEVRMDRGRQGSSPCSSTDTSDWTLECEEEEDRESLMPATVLALNHQLVQHILHIAESPVTEISQMAYSILVMIPRNPEMVQRVSQHMSDGSLLAMFSSQGNVRNLYDLQILHSLVLPSIRVKETLPWQMRFIIHSSEAIIQLLSTRGPVTANNPYYRTLAISHLLMLVKFVACVRLFLQSLKVDKTRVKQRDEMLALLPDLPFREACQHVSMQLSSCGTFPLSGDELWNIHSPVIHLASIAYSATSFDSRLPSRPFPVETIDTELLETNSRISVSITLNALYSIAFFVAGDLPNLAAPLGYTADAPDSQWQAAILSCLFCTTDSIQKMIPRLCENLLMYFGKSGQIGKTCSLLDVLLDVVEEVRGKGISLNSYTKTCTMFMRKFMEYNIQISQLDVRIDASLRFIEATKQETLDRQENFSDDSYLAHRMSLIASLVSFLSIEARTLLGTGHDGPHLIHHLLNHFILPTNRPPPREAPPIENIPRSQTSFDIQSSSSLFELNAVSQQMPRSVSAVAIPHRTVAVCGTTESQKSVLELICHLCDGSPSNILAATTILNELFYSFPWSPKSDWEYQPDLALRGRGNYVGLRNGGATCYMNSIFQQLFMIPELRSAILNAPIPEDVLKAKAIPSTIDFSERKPSSADRAAYALRVLAAVQSVFAHLVGYELESYVPTEFWNVFNFKLNGETVNVREQQDALEFHNMVTDLIDEGMKKCGLPPVCENLFGGTFADEKICKDCPHRYLKEERFTSLAVDVRSHNNLRDSLKEYVKGDVLENDNAYHCEDCDAKVTAIKRMSISRLPPILIVQLKRFDFDWEKDIAVKFNDYFEFPIELDVHPYTQDGLSENEAEGDPDTTHSSRDYLYVLRGVVVHSGQATGGHYYSFIRTRDDEGAKWFRFDDTEVTSYELNEAEVKMRWFGADHATDDKVVRMKRRGRNWWNAYIIFYEKVEMSASSSSDIHAISPSLPSEPSIPSPSPDITAPTSPRPSSKSVSPLTHLHKHFSTMSLSTRMRQIPPRLEEMVRQRNTKILHERALYSQHFFQYATKMARLCLETRDQHVILTGVRFFSHFLIYTGLHAISDLRKHLMDEWTMILREYMAHRDARLWYVANILLHPEVSPSFLFLCPTREVRELFAKVVETVVLRSLEEHDRSTDIRLPGVTSSYVSNVGNLIRDDYRLASFLIQLLILLPKKHMPAIRTNPLEYYHLLFHLGEKQVIVPLLVEFGALSNFVNLITSREIQQLIARETSFSTPFYCLLCTMIRSLELDDSPHPLPNPFACREVSVVRRNRLHDFNFIRDNIQYHHQSYNQINNMPRILRILITEFVKKATSPPAWALDTICYVCFNNEPTSNIVIEFTISQMDSCICPSYPAMNLLTLLKELFQMDDGLSANRFSHLMNEVRLLPEKDVYVPHGLRYIIKLPSSKRIDAMRVITLALEFLPGAKEELQRNPDYHAFCTDADGVAMAKMLNTPSTPTIDRQKVPSQHDVMHRWTEFRSTWKAQSAPQCDLITFAGSSDDVIGEDPTGFSSANRSPNVELGEKRPFPATTSDEENERAMDRRGSRSKKLNDGSDLAVPLDNDVLRTSHPPSAPPPLPPPSYDDVAPLNLSIRPAPPRDRPALPDRPLLPPSANFESTGTAEEDNVPSYA